MNRLHRTVAALLVLGSVATAPARAAAQTPQDPGLAKSGEGLGATFAVQWTSPGFTVDYAARLLSVGAIRSLNAVGEFHYKTNETYDDVNVLGGVRLARHNKHAPSPFAQVIAGLHHEMWHDNSPAQTCFRLQPGGGFNFRLPRQHLLLRTQLDFPINFFPDDSPAVYLRVSVGLEFHFGR